MSQKFRVRELKIKSAIADRSGLVTENMTSTTPSKVVGTTFKNVVVNEAGEFVVDDLATVEKIYVAFSQGTVVALRREPSF